MKSQHISESVVYQVAAVVSKQLRFCPNETISTLSHNIITDLWAYICRTYYFVEQGFANHLVDKALSREIGEE